jgi:rhodanese-related sulfurtransferase
VLDICSASDFETERIAGAVHIPYDELQARAGELDSAKLTVVY